MRAPIILVGLLAAQALKVETDSSAENTVNALMNMKVGDVNEGRRILVLIMKTLGKFTTKIDEEDAEDDKQCKCRQTFMENELTAVCGTNTCTGINARAEGTAGGQIGAARAGITSAQGLLATAIKEEGMARESAEMFQKSMERTQKLAAQDEALANERHDQLVEEIKRTETMAKAVRRAQFTIASEQTGGMSSGAPSSVVTFVQLTNVVKAQDSSYADKMEKELKELEAAAGYTGAPVQKQQKASSPKIAAVQTKVGNDKGDLLHSYLSQTGDELEQEAKDLRAELKNWQDATGTVGTDPNSKRDMAIARVRARMGKNAGGETSMDFGSGMTGYRGEQINKANFVAEYRRDLSQKNAQLSSLEQYAKETMLNQVSETRACSERKFERAAEKKACNDAIAELTRWRTSEWQSLALEQGPTSFVQLAIEESSVSLAQAGTSTGATAFETLKQLRTNFEFFRAQMQESLNDLTTTWQECKASNRGDDEDLTSKKLALSSLTAKVSEQSAVKTKAGEQSVHLQDQVDDLTAKKTSLASKRKAQRTNAREEAEACESSLAVVHKVIEVLSSHYQGGNTTSAIDGLKTASISARSNNARNGQSNGNDAGPAAGIQHMERTHAVSSIIHTLQKVEDEFSRCSATVRNTDSSEENDFRRTMEDLDNLITDYTVDKAHKDATETAATNRHTTLEGERSTAETEFDSALQVTRDVAHRNCEETIEHYMDDAKKLGQKIDNAISVKDLIMVAMQNLRISSGDGSLEVGEYPQDCAFEMESGVVATTYQNCTIIDTATPSCSVEIVAKIATPQTDGGLACPTSGIMCMGTWACDNKYKCTCTVDESSGGCDAGTIEATYAGVTCVTYNNAP